jgi:serine/threonine-protein kinase RsbW
MSPSSETSAADGQESRTVRLSIPAKPEYITLCRLALTGLARVRPLTEETLSDLKLALTEACSNSVRHAYDDGEGNVEILYELHPDRFVIEVADHGNGFDPAAAETNGDPLTEGGLGLSIIRSVADEFEIGSQPGGQGARLRFVKVLSD